MGKPRVVVGEAAKIASMVGEQFENEPQTGQTSLTVFD